MCENRSKCTEIDVCVCKETCAYAYTFSRIHILYTRKETYVYEKRPKCAKRDVFVWKETCICIKRDLYTFCMRGKRPTYVEKRPIYAERDVLKWKETCICMRRDLHTWKETYKYRKETHMRGKRSTYMKTDVCICMVRELREVHLCLLKTRLGSTL